MSVREPDSPSFAVVCSAYNASGYIQGALASALGQTCAPDEIVVVDDGSDDDTGYRARSMGRRVRVIRTPHRGVAAARNTGTSETRSRWIAYLDADDRWDLHKLEVLGETIVSTGDSGLVFSDFRRSSLDEPGARPETNTDLHRWFLEWPALEAEVAGHRVRVLDRRNGLKALLRGYPVFTSSAAVRRDVLEEVGGWDPRFTRAQDFDLWLRLVRRRGMVYLDEVLTTVQVRPDHRGPFFWISRQFEWDLRVMQHHLKHGDLDSEERKLFKRYLGERTVWRGDLARRYRRWRDAIRWYLKAARHVRQIPRVVQRLLSTLTSIR